jgi:hypothetical protein
VKNIIWPSLQNHKETLNFHLKQNPRLQLKEAYITIFKTTIMKYKCRIYNPRGPTRFTSKNLNKLIPIQCSTKTQGIFKPKSKRRKRCLTGTGPRFTAQLLPPHPSGGLTTELQNRTTTGRTIHSTAAVFLSHGFISLTSSLPISVGFSLGSTWGAWGVMRTKGRRGKERAGCCVGREKRKKEKERERGPVSYRIGRDEEGRRR